MRYLVWILRLLVFVVVLLFAMKNTEPVKVNFYADYAVENIPLIVVMLVVFVAGALFGMLLTVPMAVRRRREASRLRREAERLRAAAGEAAHDAPVSPDAIAPMTPV
jgi:uncharacterized integral membrane protein